MKVAFISPWRFLEDSQGMGDKSLIHAELTAFFASRQCPGSAIRATMDWATRYRAAIEAAEREGIERLDLSKITKE